MRFSLVLLYNSSVLEALVAGFGAGAVSLN